MAADSVNSVPSRLKIRLPAAQSNALLIRPDPTPNWAAGQAVTLSWARGNGEGGLSRCRYQIASEHLWTPTNSRQ